MKIVILGYVISATKLPSILRNGKIPCYNIDFPLFWKLPSIRLRLKLSILTLKRMNLKMIW